MKMGVRMGAIATERWKWKKLQLLLKRSRRLVFQKRQTNIYQAENVALVRGKMKREKVPSWRNCRKIAPWHFNEILLKTVISLGKFHLCKSRLALLKNQPSVKKSSAEIDLLDFKEDWHSNKWKRPNGTNKGTKTCAKCRFNSSLTQTLLKEPFFLIIMRSQELFVVF